MEVARQKHPWDTERRPREVSVGFMWVFDPRLCSLLLPWAARFVSLAGLRLWSRFDSVYRATTELGGIPIGWYWFGPVL